MKILSKSSDETVELGEKLAKLLKGGEVVALYGDLGGGKTQFTKGVAKGLGIEEDILSPTFVIRREYIQNSSVSHTPGESKSSHPVSENMKRINSDRSKNLNLLHYDFYRFDVPDEALVESLEEGINPENITVIEWAERVEKYLPEDTIKITFHYVSENEREIEVKFGNKALEKDFNFVIPTDSTE